MPTWSSASTTARRSSRPGRRIGPSRGKRPIITTSSTVTGNAPVDELGLGDVRDAPRLAARRRAEDLDPAGPRLEQPRHELEQRALAGAVGADDREQAAGLDRDRHVLERDPLAVARGDVAQPHVRMRVGVRRVELACRGVCGDGRWASVGSCETQYQLERAGCNSREWAERPRRRDRAAAHRLAAFAVRHPTGGHPERQAAQPRASRRGPPCRRPPRPLRRRPRRAAGTDVGRRPRVRSPPDGC